MSLEENKGSQEMQRKFYEGKYHPYNFTSYATWNAKGTPEDIPSSLPMKCANVRRDL